MEGDVSDTNKRLGLAVRESRQRANVSMADLASQANVSRATIHNIERGSCGTSFEIAWALARLLCINLNNLTYSKDGVVPAAMSLKDRKIKRLERELNSLRGVK